MMEYTVRGLEIFNTNSLFSAIKPAMIRTTARLLKIGEEAAKEEFKAKRNTSSVSSGRLMSSFYYENPFSSGTEVRGVVFMGGPTAPYAPIVEEIGWKTKTGRKDAYHIMGKAVQVVSDKGIEILNNEINKVGG